MYQISKKFEFSAAHHLPGYKGKCANVHGHNYTVEVTLAGDELDEQGMLFDYHDLGKIVKDLVLDSLDHTDLNKSLPDSAQPPTAENTAKWIYGQLKPIIKTKRFALDQVAVWETPTSCAIYKEK